MGNHLTSPSLREGAHSQRVSSLLVPTIFFSVGLRSDSGVPPASRRTARRR